MIPQIIHQSAPLDRSKWNPVWEKCHPSWVENFPKFDHMMWTDEKIDQFIREHYSDYYELYQSFPVNICRWDLSRLLILHHFGGIYADMDVMCFENFYDDLLQDHVNIVESAGSHFPSWQETVQNSLMASPAKCEFWLAVADEIKDIMRNKQYRDELHADPNFLNGWIVKAITGPIMLTKFLENNHKHMSYKDNVYLLPNVDFNPRCVYDVNDELVIQIMPEFDVKSYKTIHVASGSWIRK
jgi:mannosyltransferase OCH1-like enzyme